MADNVTEILLRARMETSGVEAGVGQIQKSLKGLSLPKGLSDDLEKSFSKLGPLLKDYQRQLNKGFSNKKDLQNFSAIKDKVQETFGEIRSLVQQANSQDIRLKVDTQEISRLQNEITKVTTKLQESLNNVFNSKVNTNNISTQLEKVLSSASRSSSVKTMTSSAMKLFDSQDYAGYNAQIDRLKSKILELKTTKFQLAETLGVKDAQNNIDKVNEKITNFFNNIKVNGTKVQHIEDLKTQLQSLGVELDQVQLESLSRGAEQLAGASSSVDNLSDSIQRTGVSCEEAASGLLSMKDQVSQLQTSTQYFFSLRNMINLFRRGVQDAIETVKNLDAAMTETAVVTNFSVGDMWEKLPEYTANANALGATVQDMYESTTLYYQQGLNTEQAMGIAAETMKMARIAGLEAADATDKMTAALRGFNMEINETSAQRINDVYSNLAAKTASNTEELGTAMQRTASIANSAGMSFEGTAAFLAQAIETTREPAENLGTAMKTIVARFQELKKNPLEITEVDGEEVSYNKVDTALQSIGVSLKDTNGQFRALDEVFLEISERWDGLTQTQQRYIATTAAGSRQQSRFIAMMSDYERTMQLMDYANNSAGASEEQFGKTLEGLEAKLNRLTNAWNQFLMGIANSSIIKGSVDGITGLLGGINNLIDKISGNNGVIKSVLSLYAAFTGLKAGGKIINSLIGGLGGMVDPASSFGIGFGRGMTGNKAAGNAAFAAQINQPIVAGLKEVVGAINKSTAVEQQQNARFVDNRNAYAQRDAFRDASLALKDSFKNPKTFSVSELRKQLGGLTGENQNILMRSNASLFGAGTSALLGNYVSNNPKMFSALKAGEKNLNNARKAGQLTAEQYFQHLQDPGLLKDALLRSGIEQSNPAYKYLDELNNQVTSRAAEITKQQTDAIQREFQSFQDSGDYAHLTEADLQKRLQKEVLSEEAQARIRQQALGEKGLDPDFKNSTGGRILQGITRFGGAISQAGMGIQAFGGILMSSANPALQTFGSALTSVGGLISGLGMTISGVGSAFTAISSSSAISGIATSLGVAASTVTGVLFALAAAIGGILYYFKKVRPEKIKEAGEKVTTNYKEKNDKAQSNISNLESYREDFARLRAGVDESGMNINLDNSDYERWLEITRTIADLNPEIVDGYNAQGDAIINNNNALEDTIAKEKDIQANTFEEYISPDSTKNLIAARNLSRQIARGNNKYLPGSGDGAYLGYEFAPQGDMRKQASKIGETLKKGVKEGWASENILSDFNIDINKLAEGDSQAIQAFEQNYDKIKTRISNKMDSAGDDLKDKTKESMLDAFSGYSEASEELDELITPLYEQQLAKIGQNLTVPDEFKGFLNQGIKDIVSDANIENVDAEIQKLTDSFSALGDEGSEYQKILDDVEKAQDEYASSLKEADYKEAAEEATDRIKALKDELVADGMDITQGYGKAVSEFLDNEIKKIEDFTQAGQANLQRALNTMVDEITAAEGVLENFNKVAEGSTYGKAASNMAQIYETATADEHVLGQGDQAFWAGAEAIVGRQNLLEGGKVTKDKALKQMKEVQEMLKGGQEGWDNFKIKWFDSADAKIFDGIKGLKLDDSGWIKEIDENLNPEVYDQIANKLNMSKESLIAMLNLGRQFGEVDFTNVGEVRKALATSESTIKNSENGQVFVKREALESEMTSAGIDLNKQQDIINDLQKDYNTELIKSADEITKTNNQFAKMGIDSMDSLVKTFDDTGQFTKDEIQAYAQKWAEFNGQEFNQKEFDEKWQANQEDTEFGGIPSSLDSIQSILSSIESILASQRLADGYLDNPTAEASKDWLLGGKGQDTDAQYFWKGKGADGKDISTSDFNKTSSELTDFINKSRDYVDQLSKVEPANETERQEINKEIEDYNALIDRAETYLTEGTEVYNNNLQEKIDGINNDKEVVESGFADLFSGITPESINTDSAQQALGQVYKAIIDNAPIELDDSTASQNLVNQLQKWGISIEQALDAGLVTDDNHLYTKAKEAGKKPVEDVNKGAESGVDNAQTDASGGAKKAEDKAKKAVEDPVKGAEKGVDGAEDSGAGAQKAEDKVRKGLQEYMDAGAKGANQVTPPTPAQPSKAPTESQPQTTESTTVLHADTTEIDAAKTKIEELASIAQQGATYTISVPGAAALARAAANAEKLSSNSGQKTIDVKTGKVDKSSLDLKPKTVTIPTKADNTAQKAINAIKGKSVQIKISPVFTGTWTKTATVNVRTNKGPSTGGYITSTGVLYRSRGGIAEHPGYPKKGTDRIPAYLTAGEYVQNKGAVDYFGIDFMRKINHKDLQGALQSFGSAARGRYGRLGPKGKGGLTLTGEKGFEVAWIPSENRSMILGVDGPQMTELPADAIVWDHEQSKKIVSQNAIPAGSHYVKGRKATDPRSNSSSGKSSSSKSKKSKSKKSKSKKSKSNKNINNFSIEEVVRFNIDQKLTKLTDAISKRTKEIEKSLSQIGKTYKDISKSAEDQIEALKGVKNYNQQLYDSYSRQLKDYRSRQAVISYTNSSGKSKTKTIKISDYLNADGSINQAAVQKAGGREVQEAIYKELNSVKSIVDGMNNAQKAIEDVEQQINDLGKQISETFYQWENELTEVYDLTQRIENEISLVDRFTSQVELELSKLNAGFGKTSEAIKNIRSVLTRSNETIKEQIKNQQQMIAARQRELDAALSYQDEADRLTKFRNQTDIDAATKAANIEWAEGLEEGARLGSQYVSNIFKDFDGSIQYTIDWEKFNADNNADPYSKTTYEAIKKYLDDLNEKAVEFNNAIKEQTDFIAQTYESLSEYQDFIADFEDTLIQGLEEEIENANKNAKKLNDSIAKSLKDLLDEVKRKLDQRRKQEDNEKTERDISQKQQRLAALRADTSGGNQVEIAKLEKEIADAQQSYQRTLEDQLLERLQQQADEAQKQRERQIELAEAANDIASSTNKELVDLWLKDPTKYQAEIRDAWLTANNYEDKGQAGQYILEQQFNSSFAELITAVEQSGFNNIEPFTAIEDNTNTLVYLLTQLTNEQLGRYDPLSLGDNKDDALVDATERNTNSILDLIRQGEFKKLRDAGIDAETLRTKGATAEQLIGGGYTAGELKQGGYTAKQVKEGGISDIGQLKEGGFTVGDLKDEFEFSDLFANFTPQEMAKVFDATIFKTNDISYAQALQGFGNSDSSLEKLRNAGYTEAGAELTKRAQDKEAAARAKAAADAAAAKKAKEDAYWNYLKEVKKVKPANVKTAHIDKLLNLGSTAGRSHAQVLKDLVGGAGGSDPFTWKNIFKAIINSNKINRYELVKTWPNGDGSLVAALKTLSKPDTLGEIKKHKNYKNAKNLYQKFASGGIADFTGPAWLDGTPSRPELVLNATDTKNFIALKDVLSKAMSSTSAVGATGGNTMYEININVDHINSDYDVDRLAERIKKDIVKDSGYRNVTQVRKFR